jgi:hypothetical protein
LTGITAFMRLKVPLVIRFHGSDTIFVIWKTGSKKNGKFCLKVKGKKSKHLLLSNRLCGKSIKGII